MTVLEIIARLVGDTKDVDAKIDATEKRAVAMSDKVQGAIGKGAKLVAGAAALTFGVATKGLLELEYAQAAYTAETGATADEAARAGDAINDMFGRNLQPMEEIGRALSKVRTNLGETGEAGEKLTQDFLTFARVTRRDAGAAVLAFDDILDAWGLTGKDAKGIMDQLWASHQRFGTAVEAGEVALARMAPALRAMNLTVDDGIGLLNLFAVSGLDASAAQRGLNSAIENLPAGESFDQFLVRLSKIEDPLLRAQAATDVLGVSVGPKLAAAVKPGMTGLRDFSIAASDAAGTIDTAREAMDSTFGTRVQMMLRGFTSELISAAKEVGPLVTGLASLTSLGAAAGMGPFLKSLGGVLVAGLKEVGTRAGNALSDGMQAVWSGASGTVIGNNIASRIENIMDPTKSTVIGNVWRMAASKAATVYLSALIFQDAIVAGIGARFGAVWGRAAGAAAGVAFKLGVVGIGLVAAEESGLLKTLDKALDDLPWPLGSKGAPDWARQFGLAKAETKKGLGEILGEFLGFGQSAQDVLGKLPGALAAALGSGALSGTATDAGDAIRDGIAKGATAASKAATTMARDILATILGLRADLISDSQASADAIFNPMIAKMELAETVAERTSLKREIASGKLTAAEKREAKLRLAGLDKELIEREATVASFGTTTAKIAHEKLMISRIEQSAEYKKGSAEQKAILADRLTDHRMNILSMQEDAKTGTGNIRNAMTRGLRSGKDDVRTAAEDMTQPARDHFGALGDKGFSWGKFLGSELGRGLTAAKAQLRLAAHEAAFAVRDVFAGKSPPPKGPLHKIDQWGFNLGRTLADNLVRGFSLDNWQPRIGGGLAAALAPLSATHGLGLQAQATIRLEHHLLAAPGVLPPGTTADEVAGILNAGVDATGLLYQFRHAASTR